MTIGRPARFRERADSGAHMLTILFDGIAYGMLLFVLASGLSVTLGLMNFINLAHGAFAMAGGYITRRAGQPARRAVPRLRCRSRFVVTAAARRRARAHALRARLRASRHLDQVLFTIGLVFMSVAGGRLRHGLAAAVRADPELPAGPVRRSPASASAAIGC